MDCLDSWKAPIDKIPTQCREFSVNRQGLATNKIGCGSSNIRRKENIIRDQPKPDEIKTLDDVITGIPACVSGIMLKPIIDWEMGENDDEAEVRPDHRELAINGRHEAFRIADRLDGNKIEEGVDLEQLRATAALTIHIIDAASLAWAKWHYIRSGSEFTVLLSRYGELKSACIAFLKAPKGL